MRADRLLIPAALTAVLVLAGCATQPSSDAAGGGRLQVVASTDVWGDLAETVGGDRVQVTSVIDDPSKDPHEYQADARTQLAVSRAAVIVENGGGYDDFIDTMRKAAGSRDQTVLNAVELSGLTSSDGELNEHVWYDFPTVQKVIDAMADAFAAKDAAGASDFRANGSALKERIATLEQRETQLKAQYAGQPVSITEPVPLYLLDAIGLVNKTPEAFSEAVENDTDAAPAVLQATEALYRDREVRLLAYNEQTTGSQTEAVLSAAKQAGIPVVPVTETLPEGEDYVGWMTKNLDAVAAALAS